MPTELFSCILVGRKHAADAEISDEVSWRIERQRLDACVCGPDPGSQLWLPKPGLAAILYIMSCPDIVSATKRLWAAMRLGARVIVVSVY